LTVVPCITVFSLSGKVTALTRQKRNIKRINVYLDGEYALALPEIEAARLKIGQWLDDGEIAALREADERERARERALNLLSYRPRSLEEIRRNLEEKEFSEQTIEATLQRLENAGLVDDLEFARYWVEQRRDFRPRGAAMLRYELRRKGVSRRIIEQILANLDEEELADRAARAWLERKRNLEPEEAKRKLYGYLVRRGFAYSIVRETLEHLEDRLDLK
jgi:regulatory protein